MSRRAGGEVRILVYPHSMEIGGSQLNAIELAAAVRDLGHTVMVASSPGPLVQLVHRLGLEHISLRAGAIAHSTRLHRDLTHLTDEMQFDVVHGYEWPPTIALYLGPHLRRRVPIVCTVLSMAVAPFLPWRIPLVVGTESIRSRARATGHTDVSLIEPPVDTDANAPDFDGSEFRARHGFELGKLLIVVVGRLATQLKLEGLLSACDAIGAMAADGVGVQLAIVGDGAAKDRVVERASRANILAGYRAIVLTGSMDDPRPAYAAADILLGMGGSALRGMAFGKPLIVQGELGFWQLCAPQTAAQFLEAGWYGLGDLETPFDEKGLALGAQRLRREVEPLLADGARRAELGEFGRRLVVERFSLTRAAVLQEKIYSDAVCSHVGVQMRDVARSVSGVVAHGLRRRLNRWLAKGVSEDFNAVPVLNKQTARRMK